MALLELFITATMPVLKLLLVTALGSYLALDHVNIMGEDSRKAANKVVFYVFTPALIASHLANTITYDNLIKLWFMPLNVLITFMVGSLLGWIVIRCTRPPEHLRGLILGCCAAGNMGNLLLIIIPAVCKEQGSPFGDTDVCYTTGMGYASLSMALGAIYLWSYVYNIVRIHSTNGSKGSTSDQENCTEPLLSSKEFRDESDQENCTSQQKLEITVLSKIKLKMTMLVQKLNLKKLFAPSTIAAIVGFAIGLVPLIRRLMIGDGAPLRVIQDSASLLGDGAIPAMTLILGGNLLRGMRGRGVKLSVILGIVVSRYILLPIIGVGVVRGAIYLGWVHSQALYQFVLLIQFAVPPAMNIGTITQLFGVGESECSVIMLWSYALASVSLSLWSTFFMWLVI